MNRRLYKMGILIVLGCLLVSGPVLGGERVHPEAWYQERFCKDVGGVREVQLYDRGRVDCATDNTVYELGFADDFASWEQVFRYARITGKKPVFVVIIENMTDLRYLERQMNLSFNFNRTDVRVVFITSQTYE